MQLIAKLTYIACFDLFFSCSDVISLTGKHFQIKFHHLHAISIIIFVKL